MNAPTPIPTHRNAAATRKITLLMLLCGLVLSGTAGAAQATAPERDAPHLTVQFLRSSLATDEGARTVYKRIVSAAESVCPLQSGSRFVTESIQACREEAIARAVHEIGNTRLAALHATSANHG